MKLPPVRSIRMWVIYDPARRWIIRQAKFKRLLPEPSKASGHIIVQMKGTYVSKVPR